MKHGDGGIMLRVTLGLFVASLSNALLQDGGVNTHARQWYCTVKLIVR